MKTRLFLFLILGIAMSMQTICALQKDTIQTSDGKLVFNFVGHGSLFIEFKGKIIHIDPYSHLADYSTFPKADLILITHGHPDHMDSLALSKIEQEKTEVVCPAPCKDSYKYSQKPHVMDNGTTLDLLGIHIEAVPAYNVSGKMFHPKGVGNGYILSLGGKRIYIAGDTQNIPEMKTFGTIDYAFIPMNLPYTMTPEQMSDAALMVHPKVLYPYHYGDTDVSKLLDLLKDHKEIEVRVRDMK